MENKEEKKEIKVILVGDSGVGKTNLINTSIGLNFIENNESTNTSSFFNKQFTIKDKKYYINLWDTAGQEKYRNVTKLFFKGAEIVILVYDISNLETFNSLEYWYETCENIIDTEHIYGVIGNKIDLFGQEEVNEEKIKEFSQKKKAKFQYTSAKTEPKSFERFIEKLIIEYTSVIKDPGRISHRLENKNPKNDERKKCC